MKEIFDWVPWFRELAGNISEGGEAYLIERANKVEWGGTPALLGFGDEAINPFSFFYFLAFKNTPNKWRPVYESVSDVFEVERLDTDIDEDFVFPRANFGVLFYDKDDPQSELLWRLFRQAAKNRPEIVPNDFMNVLGIKGVKVIKLTHTLFLINPNYFHPVDNITDDLSKALGLSAPSAIETDIRKEGGYEKYRTIIGKLREAFPECEPYEINMFLYLQNPKTKNGIEVSDTFYQISTYVNEPDGGDYWENRDDSFKENNWVYTGGPGSGKSWGEETGYPLPEPERGDIILVRTGLRRGRAIGVVQKNDYAELGINKDSRIHVLWINKAEQELSTATRQNAFEKIKSDWKTYAAFRETDAYKPTFSLIDKLIGGSTDPMKNRHPLNQILYGPPGTGKTWNTVDYALGIIEDERLEVIQQKVREDKMHRFNELKENGQIEMVTFHQNYNYEDFIEGIRPVLTDHMDEEGNLEYELSNGVFREIAKRAEDNKERSEQTGDKSWDTDELLQDFAESIEERLESEEKIKLFPPDQRSGVTIAKIHWSRGAFLSVQLGGSVKDHRLTRKVIIRDYGAFYRGEIKSPQDIKPTHKSTASQHGNARRYFQLYERIKQFHDKEWKPERLEVVHNQNYVLIIDEINRGNIAKIFGELITLIEDSKRIGGEDETTVTLPYSGDTFGVPNNLYIIGTMNTADRSIALLDTALRRRFEFVEMMPNPDHPEISQDIEGVNGQKLLAAMNDRIRFLLDREHQIGHTYFLGIDDLKSLEDAFKHKIMPLLQEYFYDNWEKIDLVLNRNGIIEKCDIPDDLRGETQLIDEENKIYELLPANNPKWKLPDSYQAIYRQTKGDTVETEQAS